MNTELLLRNLYVLRAQLALAIAMVEGTPETPEAPVCEHPPEKRKDTTTMGNEPEYICFACGAVVKGVA